MEINLGKCKVRLKGETEWKTYGAGEKFTVPGNSSFDIEMIEMLDYVCHFEIKMMPCKPHDTGLQSSVFRSLRCLDLILRPKLIWSR